MLVGIQMYWACAVFSVLVCLALFYFVYRNFVVGDREELQTVLVWQMVAGELGLIFSDGTNAPEEVHGITRIERQIHGTRRGFEFRLQRIDQGIPPTLLRVDFNPPLSVPLSIEHTTSILGDKGLKTGDKAFDDKFEVSAKEETAGAELLGVGLREALVKLSKSCPGFELTSKGLEWSQSADLHHAERLSEVIARALEVSDRLVEADAAAVLARAEATLSLVEAEEDEVVAASTVED